MHFVDCGDEPAYLVKLRNSQPDPDWDKANTRPVKDYLGKKFNNLCGYCERFCRGAGNTDGSSSVDHFEPKGPVGTPRYRRLAFKWDNLVYACLRCNTKVKKDKFPGGASDSQLSYLKLSSEAKHFYGRQFVNPDRYVNPRDPDEPAEKFFAFTKEGRILPAEELPNDQWSKAFRTIADLELNPKQGRRRTDLFSQRAALWKVAKGLSEDPALARMAKDHRDQWLDQFEVEFPTLVKWVLNHPD